MISLNLNTDCYVRTDGDGMESKLNPIDSKQRTSKKLVDTLIYRPADRSYTSKPIIPTGRIINLVPKYEPRLKKSSLTNFSLKPREPKFVPYEPYKACVEPIVKPKPKRVTKFKRNNVDIQDLVTQMSEIRAEELKKAKNEALENDEVLIPKQQWEREKQKFETDIKNLRESNMHLENQVKFQAQVNSELKTLLVAAVGEDLESRVQHLTEDKLALARELLNSANHLTTHREHTEWLSGQCEVWRSKFLASSLMVEELARWKSALTNKCTDLKQALKHLLEERSRIRNLSLKTYQILNSVQTGYAPKTTNLYDLAETNLILSEALMTLLCDNRSDSLKFNLDVNLDDVYTLVEKQALNVMRVPVMVTEKPDVVCNAVLGAALAVGKGQMFLQHPNEHATCCKHCKGEIKEI